jgi:DNA-binding NarL/FixJ family response regulator
MATRILLADGDEEIRKLMREVINQRLGWHVCAEASDGIEAVEKAKASCPDLAVLALKMPRLDGLEASKQILHTCPQSIVIANSLYDPRPLLAEIRRAGVRAFVSKTRVGTDLMPAIEATLAGRTWVRLEGQDCGLDLEDPTEQAGARHLIWAPDPTFEGFSCSNCRWRISNEEAGDLRNTEQAFGNHACGNYPSRKKAAGI